MKRLIILADGTWGSPNSRSPSNELRLARACAQRQGKIEQVVFYDWGIASESAMGTEALSGKGIDKNIQDCYRFLVHNYTPGDELFFIGFSRGAYTVRSLCGLIRNSGLLLSIHAKRIQEAYSLYRLRGKSAAQRRARVKLQSFAPAIVTQTARKFTSWECGTPSAPSEYQCRFGAVSASAIFFSTTLHSAVV